MSVSIKNVISVTLLQGGALAMADNPKHEDLPWQSVLTTL